MTYNTDEIKKDRNFLTWSVLNKFSSLLFPKITLIQENENFKGYWLNNELKQRILEKIKKPNVTKFINFVLYTLFHYYVKFVCELFLDSMNYLSKPELKDSEYKYSIKALRKVVKKFKKSALLANVLENKTGEKNSI